MRKALVIMICAVAAISLPAAAQTYSMDMQATAPSAVFHSTSTMQGSGSAYSSNPTLNSDGTASYDNAAAPSNVPVGGGPRKTRPTEHTKTPMGDSLLPLLLMAAAFGGVVYLRRRKAA